MASLTRSKAEVVPAKKTAMDMVTNTGSQKVGAGTEGKVESLGELKGVIKRWRAIQQFKQTGHTYA